MRTLIYSMLVGTMVLAPCSGRAGFGDATPGLFNAPSNPGAPSPNANAPRTDHDPVTFEAREMAVDQENGIVVALGNVEIVRGANVVNADQITYYQKRDLVLAEGNVSLLQANGDVFFSDRAELKDDLKSGVIQAFKARMVDDSVLVANAATKVSPSVTKLKEASYTPCHVCEAFAPFWQLNAEKVKLDEGAERITYRDVALEMFGVPVFYSPFLSHPTPDAAAKSGFLFPQYATNDNLGTLVKVPYYLRIAEDKDLLVTPWFTTDVGALLNTEYNQKLDQGYVRVRASATNPQKLDASGNEVAGREFRGHIFADGTKELSDYSRVGFNINRTSDDTYLRRYGFGSDSSLVSRAYGEAAQDRNFALVQGLAIQGLRLNDDSRVTPLVLPLLQGYYETPADANGIRYHVAGDLQALTREEGVDQRRLSVTGGVTAPYVSDAGHVFTSTLNLRQDIYQSNNVPINGGTTQFDGTTARTLPQAALEWRYPLINQTGSGAWTVEPIVLAVAQTKSGNPQEITNEDNRLISLTDTNLFSLNRLPGLDTVDSGSRLAYGLRGQYLSANGGTFDALFGQDYNADEDTPFPNATTPGEHFSDYIGRVGLTYAPFALTYRYALDKESLAATRNAVTFGFSKPWFSLQASYRSVDSNRFLFKSEEGQLDAALPLSDEWIIYGGARRDLNLDQMVSANSGLIFKNECFNLRIDAIRTYARDRDVEPTTQFTLQVGFKNLGEFGGN